VDKAKAKKWAEKQKERLLAGKVKQVVRDVKKLAFENEQAKHVNAYYQIKLNRKIINITKQ